MQKTEAVILDLGGVLLNIDYYRTEQAFLQLGITHFHQLYTQHSANQIFNEFETGKVSPRQFMDTLKKESSQPLTDRQITDAWNAMLLDFPPERIMLLKNLKKRYRLFLLSNTNEIHLQAFNQKIKDHFDVPSLDGFFDKTYYSHLIKQRKPDKAAFEAVMNDQSLNPDTTVFMDDTPVNVEGGLQAGLQSFLLKPPDTIIDLVARVLPI